MQITWDNKAKAVYIKLKKNRKHLKTMEAPWSDGEIMIDYDISGEPTGIEILNCTKPKVEVIG